MILDGACLVATRDMTINMTGFFWMAANCVTISGSIIYMKFAIKIVTLSKFRPAFYNNVLCAVFLLPVTNITNNNRNVCVVPSSRPSP